MDLNQSKYQTDVVFVFLRLDELTPNASNGRPLHSVTGSVKRKNNFSSPVAPKMGRVEQNGSPMAKDPASMANGGTPGGMQYVIRLPCLEQSCQRIMER
jgi:hypothetical protein